MTTDSYFATLTREQADKIIDVIREDATLQSMYFGPNPGEACVIGGLAEKAGLREEMESLFGTKYKPDWLDSVALDESELNNGTGIVVSGWAPFRAKLSKEYGLNDDQICQLQFTNDNYRDVEPRRFYLEQQVNSWVMA